MKNISERLKFALELRNMKQIDLVYATGIGKSSISTYISGEYEPKQRNIHKIAKALNVSEGWLMGLNVPMERSGTPQLNTLAAGDMISLPVIGEVFAGGGIYAEHNIIEYIPTPPSWLQGNSEYVYLKIRGNSMEPEMCSGDLALVRVQTLVTNGEYAVVIIDDEDGVIKKVLRDANWLELHSENPSYPARRFEDAELQRVRVFGTVKKIVRTYEPSKKKN